MLSAVGSPRESSKLGVVWGSETLSLHRSRIVKSSCLSSPVHSPEESHPGPGGAEREWKSVGPAERDWGPQESLQQAAAPQLLTRPASPRHSGQSVYNRRC